MFWTIFVAMLAGVGFGIAGFWFWIREGLNPEEVTYLKAFYQALREGNYESTKEDGNNDE